MGVPSPNRLLDAAAQIQAFCEAKRWPFCFIGGVAVMAWGEPRLTRDADLTVFTGVGGEASYVDNLLARFAARLEDARSFALQHRVLLLRAENGIPLDISLGALPFEEKAVAGSTLEELVPGVKLRLCSPAALVVYKVFAGRPQDWLDVGGVAAKSGKLIDWAEVRGELTMDRGMFPLFVAEGESSSKLAKIKHSAYLYHSFKSFSQAMQSQDAALFIFGHSLSASDDHILKKVSKGKVAQVFISVLGPGDVAPERKASDLGRLRNGRYPLER